jgi:hypothetical protein
MLKFSNQLIDHGSKFICVNQELKDIDKQIVSKQKKNVGISYHKWSRGSNPPRRRRELKTMEEKSKVPLKKKKKANKEVVVDLEVDLDFGKKEAQSNKWQDYES